MNVAVVPIYLTYLPLILKVQNIWYIKSSKGMHGNHAYTFSAPPQKFKAKSSDSGQK